jgi:hypothetical protein
MACDAELIRWSPYLRVNGLPVVSSSCIYINTIKFMINNSPQHPLSIGYCEKYIKESVNTKFLVL